VLLVKSALVNSSISTGGERAVRNKTACSKERGGKKMAMENDGRNKSKGLEVSEREKKKYRRRIFQHKGVRAFRRGGGRRYKDYPGCLAKNYIAGRKLGSELHQG